MNNTDYGIGSTIGGAFGLIGQAVNFEHQKKLAEQQNQYNIDMWKMQADYNSPQAQMQRFKEAGLNPNLIYGQGNNGNMSSAPQMVTPNAPEYSESMKRMGEIAELFNIENLRTQIANRKIAQEKAKQEKLNTLNAGDERSALHRLGGFEYDPESGRYRLAVGDVYSTRDISPLDPEFTSYGRLQRILESNAVRTALIPSKVALMGSQRSYLQPQIQMLNYENRYKPYSFWIGQGSRIMSALPLPKLKFDFGSRRSDYYKHY